MAISGTLCSYCKQINFDALRGPSATDIGHLITKNGTGERFAQVLPGTINDKVRLGTLSRIRKESSACQLCALFYRIIIKQGAVPCDRSAYGTLDNGDIEFRADTDLSYYARISGLDTASTETFVLRRLDLTAYAASSPANAIAYFDRVLQVCDIGALSSPTKYPATQVNRTVEGMTFGGRKRPLTLDLQLVNSWMRICTDEHGRHCLLGPGQVEDTHMGTIRLINVCQQSIEEMQNVALAELKFLALSYVWGSNPPVKLLKANKTSLERPGAFHELQLPRTIADSMDLVDRLGLRYLWVDALCIIQDDVDDQSYQIGKMATIFSSAYLTIVAASGENSNAGLPGLGSSTRLYQQQEAVVLQPSENNDGLSVMNTLKSCPRYYDEKYNRGQEDVDSSKWSQRAWTVQEKALSRRTLVFTNEQVFWTCQQAYFCEESYFEVPRIRVKHYYPSVHKLSINHLAETSSNSWRFYEDLTNNYILRELTYQGDVHAAFQGILSDLEKRTKTEFLWGLPLSRFELALLWETFRGVYRRTALSTLQMTSLRRKMPFPSWCWMGWAGDICCRVSDTRRESERPSLVCFVHRKEPLHLRHVNARCGASTTSDLWTDSAIQEKEVTVKHLIERLPRLTEEILARYPEESLIFFWTHSAFFRVAYRRTDPPASPTTENVGQSRPIIQDESGSDVGVMSKTGTAGRNDQLHEFVAIGQREIIGIPESMAEDICPPVVLALQIERDEYGICSRVSYAEIGLKVWMHVKPKAALIALQ